MKFVLTMYWTVELDFLFWKDGKKEKLWSISKEKSKKRNVLTKWQIRLADEWHTHPSLTEVTGSSVDIAPHIWNTWSGNRRVTYSTRNTWVQDITVWLILQVVKMRKSERGIGEIKEELKECVVNRWRCGRTTCSTRRRIKKKVRAVARRNKVLHEMHLWPEKKSNS